MLAWARMGLTLVGVPSALMAYSAGHQWVAFGASALAACLGLFLLTLSLRTQRTRPSMVEHGDLRTASERIIVTAAAVGMLSIAGLDLVLA